MMFYYTEEGSFRKLKLVTYFFSNIVVYIHGFILLYLFMERAKEFHGCLHGYIIVEDFSKYLCLL